MFRNISYQSLLGITLIFSGISSSNAVIFKAIPVQPSLSGLSGFSFDWDDKNGDGVVDKSEVSLPLTSPTFTGEDFLFFGIHYNTLSNIASVTSFDPPFFKTSGFDIGLNGNGWYFSGGTFPGGTPAGTGFAGVGSYAYKIITPHFIGPFPDFRGFGTLNLTATLPTIAKKTVHTFFGNFKVLWFDSVTFHWQVPYPIFTASYFKFTTVGDPVIEPDAVLTDIYAADLGGPLGGPDGDVPLLTGFDSAFPQIVPLSEEQFIGKSGDIYPAILEIVRLADLAARLPGYDLSRFTGDPNSIVYLAQATVPISDVTDFTTVPEPATFGLLVVGIASLTLLRLKNLKSMGS
jgi:hypothetical protein